MTTLNGLSIADTETGPLTFRPERLDAIQVLGEPAGPVAVYAVAGAENAATDETLHPAQVRLAGVASEFVIAYTALARCRTSREADGAKSRLRAAEAGLDALVRERQALLYPDPDTVLACATEDRPPVPDFHADEAAAELRARAGPLGVRWLGRLEAVEKLFADLGGTLATDEAHELKGLSLEFLCAYGSIRLPDTVEEGEAMWGRLLHVTDSMEEFQDRFPYMIGWPPGEGPSYPEGPRKHRIRRLRKWRAEADRHAQRTQD